MKKLKLFPQLAISGMLVIALLFNGCDSTSSDGNDSDGNNNEDNSSSFFNSGDIAPGETFSYTFEEEGTVEYYCEIHAPNMQGEIIVSSNEEAVERDTVRMDNDQFQPPELSIAPNTEVVWINNEEHAHHVRSGNPPSDNDDGGGY